MPYLNWKEREIQKRIEPQVDARSTLTLTLSGEERAALLPLLEEVYLREGSELRVDLPENWIVFWKSRESESRLLIAHPERGEWVTTIALEAGHGRSVLESLKGLSPGDAFSVSEHGVVGSV